MNTKMKVLSLAVVGLFGFAGAAMAACPSGPTTAEGGAWTSKTVLPGSSALSIGTPGLASTECLLNSSLGSSTTASAFVRYNHAASEPSYRFQFLVDTTALTNFSATDNVAVFQVPATTTTNGLNRLLRVSLVAGPGGAKRVRFIASCATGTCNQTFATDLVAGVNRIEGKLTVGAGAAGQLTYWVNAAAGTTEPAASGTIANLDNAGWGGASAAALGLTAPSAPFKNNHAAQVVKFDQFDSRRQTYIGY